MPQKILREQDATASCDGSMPKKECDSAKDQSKNWVTRFVNAGHDIMWPPGMTSSTGPTLLTGVKLGDSEHFVDDLMEWERKFESANLENHTQFLQNAQLTAGNHPMEAAAWDGYIPEAQGLPSDQLEFRIRGSLPPLAYMVSRPRQPITAGEELLRRFDAGIRPHWLRDWQSGFGGYTKVCDWEAAISPYLASKHRRESSTASF